MQSSSNTTEYKADSLFNQIYETASQADSKNSEEIKTKLTALLSPATCIDVQNSKGETPAGKLAAEGKKAAAEMLQELGANVNAIARGAAQGGYLAYAEVLRLHHGANVNAIAEGAAQGGHHEYAEKLRLEHGANVNDIARGAAQGGHQAYAEELRLTHGASVNAIARGAAQGGYQAYAKELYLKHGATLKAIAWGAAQGGYLEYAEKLRKHGASANYIARAAALGGHLAYAEDLRLNHGASVDFLARGAAQGGHLAYAEKLRLKHGAGVNYIAWGAALGGHQKYAEELRIHHGADVNETAWGAASGGFQAYAEQLRQRHGANVNIVAEAAAQGGHRAYADELRLNHGASINSIAAGAAQGGLRTYAEELRLIGASVDTIAEGAAIGGDRAYAEELRINHGASVNAIARGAALGEHWAYVEELHVHHGADIEVIARGGSRVTRLNNEKRALHWFAFIHDDRYRAALAQTLKDLGLVNYDSVSLVPIALKIRQNMQTHSFNYDQALAWTQNDVQGLLLQYTSSESVLEWPDDILGIIHQYVAPLSVNDAAGLRSVAKFADKFEAERLPLLKELQRHYYKSTGPHLHGLLGQKHSANDLIQACTQVKSIKALTSLLEEYKEKKEYDECKGIITRHLARLLSLESSLSPQDVEFKNNDKQKEAKSLTDKINAPATTSEVKECKGVITRHPTQLSSLEDSLSPQTVEYKSNGEQKETKSLTDAKGEFVNIKEGRNKKKNLPETITMKEFSAIVNGYHSTSLFSYFPFFHFKSTAIVELNKLISEDKNTVVTKSAIEYALSKDSATRYYLFNSESKALPAKSKTGTDDVILKLKEAFSK